MVLRKVVKALARPGGPASKLPSVKGLAAAGIKKGLHYAGGKIHHAIKSGALIQSGGKAKANVQNAMAQMRGPPGRDKMLRLPRR